MHPLHLLKLLTDALIPPNASLCFVSTSDLFRSQLFSISLSPTLSPYYLIMLIASILLVTVVASTFLLLHKARFLYPILGILFAAFVAEYPFAGLEALLVSLIVMIMWAATRGRDVSDGVTCEWNEAKRGIKRDGRKKRMINGSVRVGKKTR